MSKSSNGQRRSRASSGGLKRSAAGVNGEESKKAGTTYVEVLDGVLYVERRGVAEFKRRLKELCSQFDYRFVPADEFERATGRKPTG